MHGIATGIKTLRAILTIEKGIFETHISPRHRLDAVDARVRRFFQFSFPQLSRSMPTANSGEAGCRFQGAQRHRLPDGVDTSAAGPVGDSALGPWL